jgi:hypothetical protein
MCSGSEEKKKGPLCPNRTDRTAWFSKGSIRRVGQSRSDKLISALLETFPGRANFLRKWNPLPNGPLRNHAGKTVVEFRGFQPQLMA